MSGGTLRKVVLGCILKQAEQAMKRKTGRGASHEEETLLGGIFFSSCPDLLSMVDFKL